MRGLLAASLALACSAWKALIEEEQGRGAHPHVTLPPMRDLGHYLRDYRAYVSTRLGRTILVALVWLAGMFAPMGARTLVELPNWLSITWMLGWAVLGYVFAPYGMWKHHRAQIAGPSRPDQK